MTYPFRVITFTCQCRYVQITDTKKRIMKNFAKCPVHGRVKESVKLFCLKCNIGITMTNFKAAAKQKWCTECGKKQRQGQNEVSQEKYKGRYVFNQEIHYSQKETQGEKDIRQLNELFQKIRNKFRPPETIKI